MVDQGPECTRTYRTKSAPRRIPSAMAAAHTSASVRPGAHAAIAAAWDASAISAAVFNRAISASVLILRRPRTISSAGAHVTSGRAAVRSRYRARGRMSSPTMPARARVRPRSARASFTVGAKIDVIRTSSMGTRSFR